MSKYSDQRLGKDIIQSYKKYRQKKEDYKKVSKKNDVGAKVQFITPNKYEMLQILGKGSYGTVCAALDKSSESSQNQILAIKKIQEPFYHKVVTKRMLRQLHLLRLLKHENIIKLETLLMPYSREEFDHVYIVFEFMDTDLHQILKSQQELTSQQFMCFLYQIFRGLKYIHSAGVVHRDLKPRNILLNENCGLKICDFGLSRSLTHKSKSNQLTQYVATRWYRAPEILLGSYEYTAAVDMWSVGCIFAEMLLRKPFMKGKSSKQQLQMIAQTIGIQGIQQMQGVSEGGKKLLKKLSHGNGTGRLQKIFSKVEPLQFDLLRKLLAINPQNRITAKQALEHPYFEQLHAQKDEPQTEPFPACDFEFQTHNLNTQQLKDIMYEEILTYNFPQFAKTYQQKRKNNQSLISHILVNSNKNNRDPNADQSEQQTDDLK